MICLPCDGNSRDESILWDVELEVEDLMDVGRIDHDRLDFRNGVTMLDFRSGIE